MERDFFQSSGRHCGAETQRGCTSRKLNNDFRGFMYKYTQIDAN